VDLLLFLRGESRRPHMTEEPRDQVPDVARPA
jgi:hypothetical protein